MSTGFISAPGKEHNQLLQEGLFSGSRHPDGPDNPQQLNRYSYVLDNPLRYTDASGHCPWCIVGAVAGAVAGGVVYAATCGNNCNWGTAALYIAGGAVGSNRWHAGGRGNCSGGIDWRCRSCRYRRCCWRGERCWCW